MLRENKQPYTPLKEGALVQPLWRVKLRLQVCVVAPPVLKLHKGLNGGPTPWGVPRRAPNLFGQHASCHCCIVVKVKF